METVQVEIFGQKYSIKGTAHAERIQELAAFVDATMKDIQKSTGTVESHRVAILAALTISEELYRLREHSKDLERMTGRRLHHLLEITINGIDQSKAAATDPGASPAQADRIP